MKDIFDNPIPSRAKGGAGFGHESPHQGNTNVWLTPPHIIKALGPFDLDPCAPPDGERPWDTATHHYSERQDGLIQPWFGRVWLNPPYGPNTGRWLARGAQHGNTIALVFARTETAAFFAEVWPKADGMLFIKGRVKFYDSTGMVGGTAGSPSCLIGYGAEAAKRIEKSGIEGKYIVLSKG